MVELKYDIVCVNNRDGYRAVACGESGMIHPYHNTYPPSGRAESIEVNGVEMKITNGAVVYGEYSRITVDYDQGENKVSILVDEKRDQDKKQ